MVYRIIKANTLKELEDAINNARTNKPWFEIHGTFVKVEEQWCQAVSYDEFVSIKDINF